MPTTRSAACLVLFLSACTSATSSPSATVPAEQAASPFAAAVTSPEATSTPSPTADAVESVATAMLEIDGGPDFPTEGFGSLWLLAPDSETPSVLRVDPDTNAVVATVELPGRLCQGFVVTDDGLWACTPDGAVRIDPATNAITASVDYRAPMTAGRLASGGGFVWALGTDAIAPNTLVRIDPTSESVTEVPLGHRAGTLAYGFDAVWITAPDDGLLLRFDPASGAVSTHTTDLSSPWTIAAGPDSLWLTLFGNEDVEPAEGDATVARIDPMDGSVVAEIDTGAASGPVGGLWAGTDGVWVRAPDAFLVRIDPATNEVVATVEGPSVSGDVTVAFGSVWATAVESNAVYRLEP